ncbi:unnamed protein product [Rhodiola kirilowii]
MMGKALLQFSSLLPTTFPRGYENNLLYLPPKPVKRSFVVRASSADSQHSAVPSETQQILLQFFWMCPRNIWRRRCVHLTILALVGGVFGKVELGCFLSLEQFF